MPSWPLWEWNLFTHSLLQPFRCSHSFCPDSPAGYMRLSCDHFCYSLAFSFTAQLERFSCFCCTSWQIDEETMETVTDFILLGSKITADGDWSHKIKRLVSWKKSYDKPRQHIKNQGQYFANKSLYSQSYGFSSSHVWMWVLDGKEGWALKNWCFWTVVLEKTLESSLDCKEIKPVNPKGNQSWIFIRRIDAEAPIQNPFTSLAFTIIPQL